MLRIAVVDAGDLWQNYPEAVRRVDGIDIGVVIDRDEDTARQLLVSVGGDQLSRSIDDLNTQRQEAFDAAVVHTPLESRAEVACALAALGKHLLVDAPLATTIDDVDRVSRACESANVALMLRQPLRSSPAVSGLRAAVDSGNLGAPGLVRLHHWTSHDATKDTSLLPWIWDHCYREVDLVCWLMGVRPERVFAMKIGESAAGIERGVLIHLGFAGGEMALVDCHQSSRSDGTPYFMLTVIGSTGAAYADDHRNTNLLIQDHATSLQIDSNTDPTLQLLDFARCVSGGSSRSVEDCRCVTAVIQAVLESIESGSSVSIG